jgi:hypothetical protein
MFYGVELGPASFHSQIVIYSSTIACHDWRSPYFLLFINGTLFLLTTIDSRKL